MVELESGKHLTGDEFRTRHIGPGNSDRSAMLKEMGFETLDELIDKIVPRSIRHSGSLELDEALSEPALLKKMQSLSDRNRVMVSLIGQGYYDCHVPSVIRRNVLENPGWYTSYTPYQPEISQGRLEALLNFQTLVADLTGLPIANASLLDEASAAAEAMMLIRRQSKSESRRFFVSNNCFRQTIDVLQTRADPLDIEIVIGGEDSDFSSLDIFGALLQYSGADGQITDWRQRIRTIQEQGGLVAMAADPLMLALLKSPGELGADVAVGSTQRFGVPMFNGGPHASFLSARETHKRAMPGRIVGVSHDRKGRKAYRLALQTREQHIRREKATSNICTAQALLAIMAGFYGMYHGIEGLRKIASRVSHMAAAAKAGLVKQGFKIPVSPIFDTMVVETPGISGEIHDKARALGLNLREIDSDSVGFSVDETTTPEIVEKLWSAFGCDARFSDIAIDTSDALPGELLRSDVILDHPVFSSYRTETEMMRYMRRLMDRDLALDRTMIPLGSCTMKLNAATEMIPVSFDGFANIHPFAPPEQKQGYNQMIRELEEMLCMVTGYDAVSVQPNSGAQGEYAGLLAIRAYHESRGETERRVCLIPSSAHGTNPASAHMAGMDVVVVKCGDNGDIDIENLNTKAREHSTKLAAIMVTYPSTHGVFEEGIEQICEIVHRHGGQVYVDGANLNAQIGLTKLGEIGADVSHLNLHKTFCIPHGGGGPGVGPIGVKAHLAPFLPGHFMNLDRERAGPPVAAAAQGSAGILPISYAYMKLMGGAGLTEATKIAILNANYIAQRLKDHFPILYKGRHGYVAHECILDLRELSHKTGITVEDVAKRLIDYGFHAPTMSWPVAGTLMVEPTESESFHEINRFCDAMIAIRAEIEEIETGKSDRENNVLTNAPHTAEDVCSESWSRAYSRRKAALPTEYSLLYKYWPPVSRIDNVAGDRNLICTCPPVEAYGDL